MLKVKHCSPVNGEEEVVLKKLSDSDGNNDDQKDAVKEARMLYNIHHDNFLRFKEFCHAITLEYLHFDFSVFSDDCDKVVHSLREFLTVVDANQVLETLNEHNIIGMQRLQRMWPVDCRTFTVRILFTKI